MASAVTSAGKSPTQTLVPLPMACPRLRWHDDERLRLGRQALGRPLLVCSQLAEAC